MAIGPIRSYDDVDDPAQAVARATWNGQIAARVAGLDFTESVRASGLPWAEADDDGELVVHEAAPIPE